MKSVCVFCGSSSGEHRAYRTVAETLGREIAQRKLTLVYGGGDVGLMRIIADAALAASGEVIGFIPQALMKKEIAHKGLTELHVLGSMHERKAAMEARADGFIALPGGFGTLDEFCEILTWAQLGIHRKPVGLLDVNGFFEKLLAFFNDATADGFIRPTHRELILEDTDPAHLLERMLAWKPTIVPKWTEVPSATSVP
ncbi:MAG: TIGR00730 family Rossman fold protein [Thermomicrobiales bacterium]